MNRINLLLRSAKICDSADFYKMLIKLDNETDYTPFITDERSSNLDKYISFIERAIKNSVLIFAIDPRKNEEQIVGFISASRGVTHKKQHVATIGIGILKQYELSGIGRSLLRSCIDQSFTLGIKKLEVCIPASNIKSFNLLHKFNFKPEGIKINSIFINGEYEDECLYGLYNIG